VSVDQKFSHNFFLYLIRKYNRNISFIWLPSHTGITGNELADRLANLAISSDNIDIDNRTMLSEAYDLVDTSIVIGKWQHNWETEVTGSHYRTIQKMFPQK